MTFKQGKTHLERIETTKGKNPVLGGGEGDVGQEGGEKSGLTLKTVTGEG